LARSLRDLIKGDGDSQLDHNGKNPGCHYLLQRRN
jgi:hypothetical protein